MSSPYVDPGGRYVLDASERAVDLWISERIAFPPRPLWQTEIGGPVERLHASLRALRPEADDTLACVFACPDRDHRPDVENRLFTNVKDAVRDPGAASTSRKANPFANLPSRIRFERSFGRPRPPVDLSPSCLHYRYALEPAESSWRCWRTSEELTLARWRGVPTEGLSDMNGRRVWLSFRRASERIDVGQTGPPISDDFGLRLVVDPMRALQAVANMEWIVDGVVAAFQREASERRAARVADLLGPRLAASSRDELIRAQCEGPAVFGSSPFGVNEKATWVQLSPADRWLVAGEFEVRRPTGGDVHLLSGSVFGVEGK